ncbi:MAG: pancreas/duodenum homeobox protein 1 [Proteobacteria bacterium]|nr:pancreas/duodenum homeobox protein 1 [Pseudomonadota bacterium]MBU1585406.1 pancreas/duodenum homeobox protein 1 [Pseudomonadota bacterium]MBU2452012.1 pancreas/duodenum homeobox protein 1 [Pseudomonadota bacterium]MBU2630310.1 pancreas/duodenum homeobox protein 1 [Pseudomonadota bacterium]
MDQAAMEKVSDQNYLDMLLPRETSDQFFEALYGDASDGAYDIRLEFISANDKRIVLAFNLIQRPGKCLVCSLTYGLPTVFSRHPLINIKDMIKKIETLGIKIKKWRLGETEEQTSTFHTIPFFLELE